MSPRLPALSRVLTLALVLCVLFMHIPLDAIRPARTATGSPARACCGADATTPCDGDEGDGEAAREEDHAPAPADGCDEGCHCGCCGRLPIAAEASADSPADEPVRAPAPAEPVGARRHQPREIFHPPRA